MQAVLALLMLFQIGAAQTAQPLEDPNQDGQPPLEVVVQPGDKAQVEEPKAQAEEEQQAPPAFEGNEPIVEILSEVEVETPIVWGGSEGLLWWLRGSPLPPLVTSSPAGTLLPDAGVLGKSTTDLLFGDDRELDSIRGGFRVHLGYRPAGSALGVEFTYFLIGQDTVSFTANSKTFPILARPFQNVLSKRPDSQLIGFPNFVDGSVSIGLASEFQGGDVVARRTLFALSERLGSNVDLIAGFRAQSLSETLTITESLSAGPLSMAPPGTRLDLIDRFRAENRFFGFVTGIMSERRFGVFGIENLVKVAIGCNDQFAGINGQTVIRETNGVATTYQEGSLALGSNSGRRRDSAFSTVLELGTKFTYDVTPRLQILAGYTVIFWSEVIRPGDLIDLNVNPDQYSPPLGSGPALPAFSFERSNFWAHGLNLGLALRF